jgi:hypothetical protein
MPSAFLEGDVALARVERTLLSAASDFAFDFYRTLIKKRVPHLSRLLRKVGTTEAGSVGYRR